MKIYCHPVNSFKLSSSESNNVCPKLRKIKVLVVLGMKKNCRWTNKKGANLTKQNSPLGSIKRIILTSKFYSSVGNRHYISFSWLIIRGWIKWGCRVKCKARGSKGGDEELIKVCENGDRVYYVLIRRVEWVFRAALTWSQSTQYQ